MFNKSFGPTVIEAFDLSIILILKILQSKQQYKFPWNERTENF